MLIYGKELRERMKASIKEQAASLAMQMAIVKIGDDKASQSYVNSLVNFGKDTDIMVEVIYLNEQCTQADAEQVIADLNRNPAVTGIMIQKPLPLHIDDNSLLNSIDYHKDVEGLHYYNLGKLMAKAPGVRPSTPKAVMTMLKAHGVELSGKKVAIVGRSTILGSPLAVMMTARDATVTLCHTQTRDLAAETRAADIIIAAAGKAHLLTADMVTEGCVIIDAGINVDKSGAIQGDVHPQAAAKARLASAVPGGVGMITVAELFDNLVMLSQAKA